MEEFEEILLLTKKLEIDSKKLSEKTDDMIKNPIWLLQL